MGATRVVKTLWVGGAPNPYEKLEGFDVLVLAAEEFQPSRFEYFRGQVLRCGIDDSQRPISTREKRLGPDRTSKRMPSWNRRVVLDTRSGSPISDDRKNRSETTDDRSLIR